MNHDPNCDINDNNSGGIKKPCNCNPLHKEYLGDSVYVKQIIPYEGIELTTENGYEPTNQIFLDWTVLNSLACYLRRYNPEIWKILNEKTK